jgi:hypothetical protein
MMAAQVATVVPSATSSQHKARPTWAEDHTAMDAD